MTGKTTDWSVPRGNKNQWIEHRSGREVTVTDHPVRGERVEFLNEPDDPATGPLTLKFYLEAGHTVDDHSHPEQTETLTVNSGRLRATVDGERHELAAGDNVRIPPTVPHGYEVRGEEPAVLSVSITPGLMFKEFVVAEHALDADAYPESGLNLPYIALVSKQYGPMIAAPKPSTVGRLLGAVFARVAHLRGHRIPDEPLPVRDGSEPSSTDSEAPS